MENPVRTIKPPSARERNSIRAMIFMGLVSVAFFVYIMVQKSNIGYLPLYIPLMLTITYYAFKYVFEWYHYYAIAAPAKPVASRLYTVDILTTYCAGEPFDMLEQTLTAIQQITYPHTAWCCDEADDPRVKQLCAKLGVRHVTRTIKVDAKAGNINNALQYATGELCVVLDPDHIPNPAFLDELVPYFEDPGVGYVQIVQAYYNQTESLVAKGAAQQTYQFYGPVMMSMHSYGTVQAIGANCTFRRSALDSIGGHAAGLAEDMHTAMQMHAKGWRSVYLPAILTRGLVPATMSSYYKQQLKWSRGVWELYLVVFPRLFNQFTWRQKLHYFILPFHYLSGIVFFINFSIPVISLMTGYIPLKIDVFDFLLGASPLFFMGLFIRHYVQKWVAEESDRGFHIVGGILQIGAWWIHTVGIVYTFLRKKVPYIPTPKNDNDRLPWRLSLPNILVGAISVVAIVTGLIKDYTPYSLFMALLAFMQVLFMVFILSISGYINDNSRLNLLAVKIRQRNGLIVSVHGFLRRYSLILSFIVIVVFVTAFIEKQQLPLYLPKPLPGLQVFYKGSFTGVRSDSSTIVPAEFPINNAHDAIEALTVRSEYGAVSILDKKALADVYGANKIPLLLWQPWQQMIGMADSALFRQVMAGKYDTAIQSFALQLASLQKPIFLLYQNQTGAAAEKENADNYVNAWRHVYTVFARAGATKVIWIWSPADSHWVNEFFPGFNYTDWLGVSITHQQPLAVQSNPALFDSAYRPYHRLPLFSASNMPVMVFDTGRRAAGSALWWNTAMDIIDTGFTEIKSVITMPGQVLPHLPVVSSNQPGIAALLAVDKINSLTSAEIEPRSFPTGKHNLLRQLKAVEYNKGYYWFRNRHTLYTRTIREDLSAMRVLGINAIERRMPSLYDDKIEKELLDAKMGLIPSFWMNTTTELIQDDGQLEKERQKILSVVKKNRDKPNILAWNLGDDVLFILANQSYKPGYFYYEQKYTSWLAKVCSSIRQLDSIRPLIINLHWDAGGRDRYAYYRKNVPYIDLFMLEADAKFPAGLTAPLEERMAWGKLTPEFWNQVPAIAQSGIVPVWQDIANTRYVSLDGLLDAEGRKKESWRIVYNTWANRPPVSSKVPDIRILRPAKVTEERSQLMYHLVYKTGNGGWKLYEGEKMNVQFEWFLVRIDQYGNTMYIKKVGEGGALDLKIPVEPQYYHLYAEAVVGDQVKMIHATLNTPLE